MNIQLSSHFTYKKLFRFVIPSILMMIFTSMYTIVDGFFISNFVGKIPFAAVNLIMPVIMGISTIGFMIGSGGSAIISMTLGKGQREQANKYFSMLIYCAIILSVILSTLGFFFIRPIAQTLGATNELLENSVIYGKILFAFMPIYILQVMFQSFFVAAEKPGLNLKITISAGITNIILDFIFIVLFKWKIVGAATATIIAQCVGGLIPLIYFAFPNSSLLRFCKTKFYAKIFFKTCTNGSSEMVSNLSASIVGILYNFQLMKIIGDDGIAAYGIIMYAGFIFMTIFLGYSIGSSPIVSYNYGANNFGELKNMFKKGLTIMTVTGLAMTITGLIFARILIKAFAGYDKELMDLTLHGARICMFTFIFMGINIWGSSFFTALNNGAISALISFLRTLLFQIATISILPLIWKLNGIWLSMVVADFLAFLVTFAFLFKYRKNYKY